jgi:allantoate deiminase
MDAATVMERCDALQVHTEDPGRLTRRLATPALAGAMDAVEGWMRQAGLETRRDAALNLFGRLRCGPPGAPAFLIGSHLDSVPDGGRYDGPLGVLTALAVAERLARAGTRLAFDLEVCAFSDEESTRFSTAYWSSAAIAGRSDPAWLERRDAAGVSLRDALTAAGGDPAAVAGCARSRDEVAGWLELHIEQGPILERDDLPIGVVTGIQAQAQHRFTVEGTAGHAGTTPMAGRHDALAAAAALILAVEDVGRTAAGIVATVGRVDAAPGATNVIAGHVTLTTDVRHPDDAILGRALADIEAAAHAIAAERGVEITTEALALNRGVPCDPALMAACARAIAAQGLPVRELASGAGHDAVGLSHITPVAMLFLRCRG